MVLFSPRPGHHQIAGGLVLRRGAGEDRWSQGAASEVFGCSWHLRLNLEKREKKRTNFFWDVLEVLKNQNGLKFAFGDGSEGFSVRFPFNLCVLEPWDRTRNHGGFQWYGAPWGMAGMRTGNTWEPNKSKLMVLDDPGLNCMHIITISTYTVLNIVYLTCYTIQWIYIYI